MCTALPKSCRSSNRQPVARAGCNAGPSRLYAVGVAASVQSLTKIGGGDGCTRIRELPGAIRVSRSKPPPGTSLSDDRPRAVVDGPSAPLAPGLAIDALEGGIGAMVHPEARCRVGREGAQRGGGQPPGYLGHRFVVPAGPRPRWQRGLHLVRHPGWTWLSDTPEHLSGEAG